MINKKFDKLPKLMKDAMLALKALHNTPEEMSLQCVLGIANLAIMPHYNVDSSVFGVVPTSLLLLNIAPTGAMKSTNFKELGVGFDWFESYKRSMISNDILRHSTEMKKYKKDVKQYEDDVMNNVPNPQAPITPRPVETCEYRIKKGTVNGIIELLRSQPYLGLHSSEAGEFFNSHAFQGGKFEQQKSTEMTATLTSMWDGDAAERRTAETKLILRDRRINMLFLLQESTVREFLNNPKFSEQGFVHRILITQSDRVKPPDIEFTDERVRFNEAQRATLHAFHTRIEQLTRRPLRMKKPNDFELDPEVLTMTQAAKEFLAGYNNALQHAKAIVPDEWEGFMSRARYEHPLRIAATIAAFELHRQIELEDVEAACDLTDFYIAERYRLELGVNNNNPDQSLGERRLLEWFQKRPKELFSTTKMNQYGPKWFRELGRDQRHQLLNSLVADEHIKVIVDRAANGHEHRHYVYGDISSVVKDPVTGEISVVDEVPIAA